MINQKHGKIIAGVIAFLLAVSFASYGLEQAGEYTGGWVVRAYAEQARMDDYPWKETKAADWEYDWDEKFSGAPNLYFHIGGDPYHVNEYYQPSPKDEPIEIITKETEEYQYVYDYHLYAMDITLQAKAQFLVEDDFGANSIESETTYAKDRPGDGGSHRYYVHFAFEIDEWDRFVNETNSWAGIMSVNLYENPTVGYQDPKASEVADKFGDLESKDESEYGHTQVEHDARPPQAGKLNMWTDEGSYGGYAAAELVAPDQDIPQKVTFELGAEFRSGALLGKDGAGNIEDIFPLDPYVIYHVSFGVLTVHEYTLESDIQAITQTTPASPGVPDTDLKGPIWERIWQGLKDFGNWLKPDFGRIFAMLVTLLLVFLALVVVIYLIIKTGGNQ